jgi:hypothetical protein
LKIECLILNNTVGVRRQNEEKSFVISIFSVDGYIHCGADAACAGV